MAMVLCEAMCFMRDANRALRSAQHYIVLAFKHGGKREALAVSYVFHWCQGSTPSSSYLMEDDACLQERPSQNRTRSSILKPNLCWRFLSIYLLFYAAVNVYYMILMLITTLYKVFT